MKRLKIGFLVGLAFAAGLVGTAVADLNYTQGSGTVLFDFLCFSTKHCSGHVNINSAGTEIGTSGAPIRTDPTGTTTQPVSAAALPLPAGAAVETGGNLAATATNTGAPGSTACATDTGSCNGNSLLQRIAQRISSLINALGTPMQQTGGSVTANLGTLNGAALAANQGTTADVPCTLPASATACSEIAIQKAIANAVNSPVPIGSASGGMSIKTLAALTNTAGGTAVKASAGQVYRVQCYNPDATNSAFIELFNTASVTLGTTAPFDFVEIGPGQNAGFTHSLVGVQYSTAIQAAAVKTFNSATAPTTALDCVVGFN